MAGYIKLHRDIMSWEWYKDIPVRILFEHCLLKANHEPKRWQGQIVEAGQFITSRENLAFETGLTEMQVRIAIKKLNSTSEITSKTTNRYTMITINNWNLYQQNNQQINQQISNKYPTNIQQITTNKNDKEREEYKEVEEVVEEKTVEEKKQENLNDFYGEFKNVYLPKNRYDILSACILNDTILNELINELSEAIERHKKGFDRYDEKYPDAHYLHLKAFWKFRIEHPEKFLPKNAADTGGEDRKAMMERIRKRIDEEKKIKNESG